MNFDLNKDLNKDLKITAKDRLEKGFGLIEANIRIEFIQQQYYKLENKIN